MNRERIGKPSVRADEIVTQLAGKILADNPLTAGDSVAVLVNGLGATPLMELYVASRKLAAILAEKKINIVKAYVGNYMTSLEMAEIFPQRAEA